MTLASTLRDELWRHIPGRWKARLGADCYEAYLKLHLKLMKARVESYGDEHKIEYMITEQGRSEKLIFLPGFSDSKENFYPAAQLLAPLCELVVPDLPGFGHSFKRRGEIYNLRNYTRWMQEFIEHIGWVDFHLVGNSLGGAIAAQLALVMPERLKSLTLVDAAGVVLPEQPSIYREFLNGRNIFEVTTPLQFEYFLNRVFHRAPPIPPFVWDYLYREFSKHSKWHNKILSDLLEGVQTLEDPALDQFTLNKRLKEIPVPTMIVWGDEDSFFPPSIAAFMHQQIPGSVLYMMADCGHGPQVEQPHKFAQLMKKFIRRQPAHAR